MPGEYPGGAVPIELVTLAGVAGTSPGSSLRPLTGLNLWPSISDMWLGRPTGWLSISDARLSLRSTGSGGNAACDDGED